MVIVNNEKDDACFHPNDWPRYSAYLAEDLEPGEIERITALVKEAVGLNEARGDTINVVNTPFQLPAEIEPLPDEPIWEQAWVQGLAKQVLGALGEFGFQL